MLKKYTIEEEIRVKDKVVMFDEVRKVDKISRGDIVMVELGNKGFLEGEQKGYRPAIVIQNNVGNTFSPTTIVAFITKQDKQSLPTHLSVNLFVPSTVLGEQIRTIAKDRISKKVGKIKAEYMLELDNILTISLGIGVVHSTTSKNKECYAN